MKYIIAILLLTLSYSSSAEISGGFDCKASLENYDASKSKINKLSNQVKYLGEKPQTGERVDETVSKSREIFYELKSAIKHGDNAFRYCKFTGKHKKQFKDSYFRTEFLLTTYKSLGLSEIF